MREISRREFLQMLGAVTATMALTDLEPVWGVPDEIVEEALRGPGIETFKRSICQLCPAGCGIRVRLIDGIPVHIDGNPIHPINEGGICPQGAAGLDFLYHPDRIRQPMLRKGPKGSGEWEAVSWDDAMAKLAGRLSDLRASGAPERMAFLVREKRGLMFEIIDRFMRAYGSRNLVALDTELSDYVPYDLLFGWKKIPQFDLERARFVLSFGASFLEEGPSPLLSIKAYSRMRDEERGRRGRFVFADSRNSLTAANADLFLPVHPGTHGALALGMAYVMIRERYYDTSFVSRNVERFDSWEDEHGELRPGFKDVILENYYPQRVARITGIPAHRIVEVAREFGRTRPAVALIGGHGQAGTNGLFNALAVLSLNILAGNLEKPGGVRVTRPTPFQPLPEVELDRVASEGLTRPSVCDPSDAESALTSDQVKTFCDRVLAKDPHGIDVLLVHGSNPAFDHPYSERIRAVLESVPFVVSFAGIPDETSRYADLILPGHSYLEGWMDSGETPSVAFPHAGVSQPVVEPFYDTRHPGDVLLEAADRVRRDANGFLPAKDFLSLLKRRMQGIYSSGVGTVVSGSFEESWIRFLKERGWQNLVYESFEDFWGLLVERGGWWDPLLEEMAEREFIRTDSGAIRLFIDRMPGLETGARGETAPGDSGYVGVPFFPRFDPPRLNGEEERFPYVLQTFGVLSNRDGSGSFSPLLQEMFGYVHRVYWDSWVEVNPTTAHRHGIEEGEWVAVASQRGSLKTLVVFNELLEPSVVAIPFGMGHWAGGRYARGIGVNPFDLMVADSDPLFGRPVRLGTRVSLRKSETKEL
jgi:anaerobic selenocysteine-containing dehydrogenase